MHYYTIVFGEIPAELQPIVDHNVDKWGMEVLRFGDEAFAHLEGIARIEEMTIASDCYRFDRASHGIEATEREAYIDLDCKLLKPLDDLEPDSLPYWPLDNPAAKPQPDTFILPISQLLALRVMDRAAQQYGTGSYCWPRRALRDMQGIPQIDPSYYDHKMYSVNARRALQRAARPRRPHNLITLPQEVENGVVKPD